MKKGIIGASQLGYLEGMNSALEIAEKHTGAPSTDLNGIFYSTAFQAGIDEFIIPEFKGEKINISSFIEKRSKFMRRSLSDAHYELVHDTFTNCMPEDWAKNDDYSKVWMLESFIVELLNAMSTGSSILSIIGVPNIEDMKPLIPSKLYVPMNNLLSSITTFETEGLVPKKAIQTEDINRFNEILTSDIFTEFSSAQSVLDESESNLELAIPAVNASSLKLYKNNESRFSFKKVGLGALQFTPKLIDAAFGKLPGALAETATKLGSDVIESRRRVIVYDFKSNIEVVLKENLFRMLRLSAKEKLKANKTIKQD